MAMAGITLNVSEEDAADIEKMASKVGVACGSRHTAASLLECFVADLAGGEASAGSDERMLARDWLKRRFGVDAQAC
jgi:hypothetical protein